MGFSIEPRSAAKRLVIEAIVAGIVLPARA
jgi:hypothetical protein